MTVQRTLFLFATVIVTALLCLSLLLSGLASVRLVGAVDFNIVAPASGGNTQPPEASPQSSVTSPTQTAITFADQLSQTPLTPLVPFELPVANQTTLESAPSSTPTVSGSSVGDGVPSAGPLADTIAANAAPSADAFPVNVTQSRADNASFAQIPMSQDGSGNSFLFLTALSYGTAVIVLAVMRYWSFSFDEASSPAPDSRSADVDVARGAAYSTLEAFDYGRSNRGP
jgi:hypothetical protein